MAQGPWPGLARGSSPILGPANRGPHGSKWRVAALPTEQRAEQQAQGRWGHKDDPPGAHGRHVVAKSQSPQQVALVGRQFIITHDSDYSDYSVSRA